MAQTPPVSYTSPSADVGTELWYKKAGTDGNPTGEATQIFGVQAVPSPITAKEDITYRTLESEFEFAVKGRRPFEAMEVQCIYYKEQYEALDALSKASEELWYYLKLPENQETVFTWRGSIDVSMSEIAMDGMLMMMLKIGKSTDPKIIDAIPAA